LPTIESVGKSMLCYNVGASQPEGFTEEAKMDTLQYKLNMGPCGFGQSNLSWCMFSW